MGSSMREVDFNTLAEMKDGAFNLVLRKHLKRAADDCMDRPGDSKPRKIKVEIGYVPMLLPSGDAYDAGMQLKISSSIPEHVSQQYCVSMRKNGTFVVNLDSLDSVNQNTMDFDGDDQ